MRPGQRSAATTPSPVPEEGFEHPRQEVHSLKQSGHTTTAFLQQGAQLARQPMRFHQELSLVAQELSIGRGAALLPASLTTTLPASATSTFKASVLAL